ncbi:hypothetical protein I4F81_009085 [Pyropia yezoensis]|uniref:Uncharacterized protein n=1 Tax=Pyropia yezoensis TaxID=2788 RepID=A0ACC3C8F4_PYRYE|nr:hypothetical protein I4F81_009085 [Neopyropia yezoensis]
MTRTAGGLPQRRRPRRRCRGRQGRWRWRWQRGRAGHPRPPRRHPRGQRPRRRRRPTAGAGSPYPAAPAAPHAAPPTQLAPAPPRRTRWDGGRGSGGGRRCRWPLWARPHWLSARAGQPRWADGKKQPRRHAQTLVVAAAAADDDDVETPLRPRDARGRREPSVLSEWVRRRSHASRTAKARPTRTARRRDVHNGYSKRGAVASTPQGVGGRSVPEKIGVGWWRDDRGRGLPPPPPPLNYGRHAARRRFDAVHRRSKPGGWATGAESNRGERVRMGQWRHHP